MLCLFIGLSILCAPFARSTTAEVQTNGVIAGVASVDGKPLANITVRLRDIDTGQLVGNIAANADGGFSFSGLQPGNYVVEMVSANGTILGTSVAIGLTATLMVSTNVSVGASAAAVAAGGAGAAAGTGAVIGAGGAAATGAVAGGVAAGAAGAAGLSATVIAVSAVGVTLGTTAVVAVTNDASPSR